MRFLYAIFCGAIVAAPLGAALAQEEPEAVFAKLHRASLAGNSTEVLKHHTARLNAEVASKSKAEKDASVQLMSRLSPKTYAITSKSIAPDGIRAVLRGTGKGGQTGDIQMYLSVELLKESGAWKVNQWGWSSDKPDALVQWGAKPEDVYQQFHNVILRTSLPPPILPFVSATLRAEFAKDDMKELKFLNKLQFMKDEIPKTYKITEKTQTAGGKTANLSFSGDGTDLMGRPLKMDGAVALINERGEWKIVQLRWGQRTAP